MIGAWPAILPFAGGSLYNETTTSGAARRPIAAERHDRARHRQNHRNEPTPRWSKTLGITFFPHKKPATDRAGP